MIAGLVLLIRMSQLKKFFELKQMRDFLLANGFPGDVVIQVDSEIEIAEQEDAVVAHGSRQSFSLLKG